MKKILSVALATIAAVTASAQMTYPDAVNKDINSFLHMLLTEVDGCEDHMILKAKGHRIKGDLRAEREAVVNTVVFAVFTGPGGYLLSLVLAWMINDFSHWVRTALVVIFYAPSISGSVYLVWQTLFSSDSYGWVNGTLLNLGLIDDAILWFQDADYVMGLCIVVALWTSLGTAFLSFIAGFQTVDRSMYEAAAVDGIKNRWQELYYITLPNMKPQLMFGAVMAITGAFGFGGVVDALAGNPSVDYCAWTIMHHLNDYLGARFEVGYGSAIAVVLFAIMIGANVLVKRMLSKVGQ